MSAATQNLPHVLSHSLIRHAPVDLERLNLTDLRKVARFWLDAQRSKLPREDLYKAFRQALESDEVAARVAGSLASPERSVAAVYRRYGGTVDGEVIRIDLMARGLLQIIENRVSDYYTTRRWKTNPVLSLAEKWILLPDHPLHNYYSPNRSGRDPDDSFDHYILHAGVAKHVEASGPPSWSIPPADGDPRDVTRRSPAEVALDLSQVFAFLASRGSIKARKDGGLAATTLRAMEKAVPLDEGSDYPLPEAHGLYVELLRYAGIIQVEGNAVHVDPAAATRQFAQSGAWQAYAWTRGWLRARHWFDAVGTPEAFDLEHYAHRVATARQVLVWALGCLAHSGDHWYDLNTLVAALYALQGTAHFYLPFGNPAWDPKLEPPKDQVQAEGKRRPHASWFGREGAWYANALMITLVALGLVERGRIGRGTAATLGFRLTGLGRAVFGAPEVAPPPEPGERRFLLIQPNFDVIAYLDQADATSVGTLGRLAESDSTRTGPIQTFRLTQASLYQAQESGLGHAQIVDFLRQHSQREPPSNVLQAIADWSGKRESMVLRSGIIVVGFPSLAERDAYLKRHPGTACGERFVLMPSRGKDRPRIANALVSDHLEHDRRTLVVDEHGRIRTTEPLDIVQMARLRRIARPAPPGWQLSGDSIRQAAASGLKPAQVHRWLVDHLAHPMPPLIAHAIDAWLGKGRPLELGDAVLLHVPDQEPFQAIVASRRLRPFLLGSPGQHWLAVRPEARDDLAAMLEELGFTLDQHLTPGRLATVGNREGTDEGADRRG
ncbi:MAG: helicase-associated domain-containing protein [Planctomycetaceae bacterium]|nr:helicase-associated domain-containing protein [Planctomycetaceae bacterium]